VRLEVLGKLNISNDLIGIIFENFGWVGSTLPLYGRNLDFKSRFSDRLFCFLSIASAPFKVNKAIFYQTTPRSYPSTSSPIQCSLIVLLKFTRRLKPRSLFVCFCSTLCSLVRH
jgi:hypothetical protein